MNTNFDNLPYDVRGAIFKEVELYNHSAAKISRILTERIYYKSFRQNPEWIAELTSMLQVVRDDNIFTGDCSKYRIENFSEISLDYLMSYPGVRWKINNQCDFFVDACCSTRTFVKIVNDIRCGVYDVYKEP
tara:strand:+ start:1721 stop:2116 length:396 start_codon:yes stop_codon:yes gene_type:complete